MNQEKYIGMDVHDATISAAVKNAQGKLLMECVLETQAATILEFIQGLRGTLAVTFEEGILAAWLHDLLKPHVSRLVVCDPRKNALMRDGNQNDRADARNLAELLRTNQVKAVYHGKHGTRALKELGRSYLTLTKDSTRVMNRIKSVPKLGHSLCRHQRLRPSSSCRVASQTGGTSSADSSRAFIPATG
jgi:transposase